MLRMRLALKNVCKEAVKDPKFDLANKLLAMGDIFGLTPDEFNNLIYGRVKIDDSFITSVYESLRENSPHLARNFLRKYFIDHTITFTTESIDPYPEDIDLEQILLRCMKDFGDTAGALDEAMEDKQLDMFEIDHLLLYIEGLIPKLERFRATLLRRQADLIESGNDNGHRRIKKQKETADA